MQWKRLGGAVMRRRAHLGYTTRQQFTDATGFPAKTLGDLEKHRRENFDPTTFGRLERALDWPVGTIDDILAGGPIPGEHLAVNPAAAMPADPHPVAIEIALLLADPTPLSAATRASLLNSLDRAMATARREARGLPPQLDDPPPPRPGYIQAAPFRGSIDSVATFLTAMAGEGSPLPPAAQAGIRDNMLSLYRIGLALLDTLPTDDGDYSEMADFPSPPRRVADRPTRDTPTPAHSPGVSRIDG